MQRLTLILLILASTYGVGCGSGRDDPTVVPAPPNKFVDSIVVEQVLEGDIVLELDEETDTPVNSGFVVQFEFTPAKQIPSEYHSREVLHPSKWPADVVFFERGGTSSGKTAFKSNCIIFPIIRKFPLPPIYSRSASPPKGHADIMINSFHNEFWSYGGFDQDIDVHLQPVSLDSRARLKKAKNLWFWTYFCGPKDQVGEFVYEIRVFPTAAWISTVRFELGEPVVLKRGLMRVLPVR